MAHIEESQTRSALRDNTLYLCYVLFVATLAPFQFGYHLAELNAPQDVITCEKESIGTTSLQSSLPQCIPMTIDQFAVVSSVFTLGGLIGALLSGPFCNNHGRLLTMRLMTISFVGGPLLECLAPSIAVLAIGRLVSGFGAGAAVVVVPIYISEIAPPKEKGLFGAFTQIMCCVGILVTQILGYFLSRDDLWRIILATAGIIGALQFIGLFLVPESPKWLAEHGHAQKARAILQKMRGRKTDLDAEVKAWNIVGTSQDLEEESLLRTSSGPSTAKKSHLSSVSIWSTLVHPSYRPAVVAVVVIMLAQQLTGINSIIMYSVSLLSSLLPTSAALLTVFVSLLNLSMTILCAPLSDKIGRKTSILLSITGIGISSVLLALGISFGIKALGAAATLLYVASFAAGLGPVPFIMANELVGPEAVGAVQSWALAANWIATFLVSQFFPILNQAMGEKGRIYYLFAGFAGLFAAFIAWWVPETKGKSGVEEVWGRREGREE